MEKALEPFTEKTGINVDVEVVDWGVQLDRIRNAAVSGEGPDVTQAGTTQVPFFAALGGFEDLSSRVERHRRRGGVRRRRVEDHAGGRPGRHVGRAVVHRGARHLLPQGRPREGRHRSRRPPSPTGTRSAPRWRRSSTRPRRVQPFGSPGKKAFDLVHHVMPFVWDAGGAELSRTPSKSTINSRRGQVTGVTFFADLIKDGLYDSSELERDGTQVENQFKGGKLAIWMGGPWVLGSVKRTDDENWVPAARKNVGVAPMPKPARRVRLHVRGRLGPDDVQELASTRTRPGSSSSSSRRTRSRRTTPRSRACSRRAWSRRRPTGSPSGRDFKAVFEAIQQGRTYAPVPQWAQIENAYKGRFGNILDSAAGKGATTRPTRCRSSSTRRPRRPTACWPRRRLAGPPPGRAGRTAAPPVLSLQWLSIPSLRLSRLPRWAR